MALLRPYALPVFSMLAAACAPSGERETGTRSPDSDGAVDSAAADDTAGDSGADSGGALPAYNGCTRPDGARAEGTRADPLRVETLPFTDASSTVDAPEDAVDAYDCAPSTRETGRERWYRFELAEAREVRVEVADGAGVDVDIHLLRGADPADRRRSGGPDVRDGLASGCVARDDASIVQTLEAGTWWIAADTYAGADGVEYAGDYRLSVEAWASGVWTDVPVAEGVTWRHFEVGGAEPQRVDAVFLDPSVVSIAPVRHDGCERVEDVAARTGARVGINASFFDESCAPRTFLRIDGQTLYTPDLGSQQRAALWEDGGTPVFRWIPEGGDDTSRAHGIGSYPSLRTDDADAVDPDGDSSFFTSRHPRTGFGVRADGRVGWVVVDGRSDRASGSTMEELADLMGVLGLTDAVNLDGGGSSTLYVEGCSVTGVVNFPSDGGGDAHDGARSVADGVYAWSR